MKNWGVRGFGSIALIVALTVSTAAHAEEKQQRNLAAHYGLGVGAAICSLVYGPVKIIYAKEGTPFVTSPTAIFADAPHPNAARVLQNFLYTAKIQQLLVTEGGLRSVHPDTKEPADRTPLKDIKLLADDPVGMLPQIAEIKKRYTAMFGN